MDKLEFIMKAYTFSFELRPPITVVDGDSGVGKSLFWRCLLAIKQLPEYKNKYTDVILMNRDTDIKTILGSKDKLFVIDNGDILFDEAPEVVEFISLDALNQYIIMCRCDYNFEISPNHYANIVEVDNKFTLSYEFNLRGWY